MQSSSVSHKRTNQLALNLNFFIPSRGTHLFVAHKLSKLKCSCRRQRFPAARCSLLVATFDARIVFTTNLRSSPHAVGCRKNAIFSLRWSICFDRLLRSAAGILGAHETSQLWFQMPQDDHAEHYIKRSKLCVPALTR